MLCAREDRKLYLVDGRCPDCNGCVDDTCVGCGRRWCGGTYAAWQWTYTGVDPNGKDCDRCPLKVPKLVAEPDVIRDVRCNGNRDHDGNCHWDPSRVGLAPKEGTES